MLRNFVLDDSCLFKTKRPTYMSSLVRVLVVSFDSTSFTPALASLARASRRQCSASLQMCLTAGLPYTKAFTSATETHRQRPDLTCSFGHVYAVTQSAMQRNVQGLSARTEYKPPGRLLRTEESTKIRKNRVMAFKNVPCSPPDFAATKTIISSEISAHDGLLCTTALLIWAQSGFSPRAIATAASECNWHNPCISDSGRHVAAVTLRADWMTCKARGHIRRTCQRKTRHFNPCSAALTKVGSFRPITARQKQPLLSHMSALVLATPPRMQRST